MVTHRSHRRLLVFLSLIYFGGLIYLSGRLVSNTVIDPDLFIIQDTHIGSLPDLLQYKPHSEPFNVSRELLTLMDFPLRKYVTLDDVTMTQYVFVTAANGGYAVQVLDAIATVQKYYPDKKIIFYNLGGIKSANETQKIKNLCNVEYREFNFTKYPGHVRKLHSYTWKPLVIYEVLKEYRGLFWMDATVRFLSANLSIAFPILLSTGGIHLFNYAGHNTFVVTHNDTYSYLPTNLTQMQSILQYESGTMLIFGTQTVFDDVIKWWVLCALVERCMAPVYALGCKKTAPDVWAGCHRYDQTTINILLANKYNYDYRLFAKHYDNLEIIKRSSSLQEKPLVCHHNRVISPLARSLHVHNLSHPNTSTPKWQAKIK